MNSKTLTILTLLLAAASHSFAAYSDNILNYGHADIGVAFGHHEEEEGGDHGEEEHGEEFHLHLHGHDYGPAAVVNGVTLTSDAEFDAGDVTILVPLATKATAPDNSAFNAATGAAAATPPQCSVAPTPPSRGRAAWAARATRARRPSRGPTAGCAPSGGTFMHTTPSARTARWTVCSRPRQ